MASVICTYEINATDIPYKVCHSTYNIDYIIHDGTTYEPSTEFTFPNMGLQSLEFVLRGTEIASYAFQGVPFMPTVVISDDVTAIGNEAFYYCEETTGVTIGSGVTSIGNRAFGFCSNLTQITSHAVTAPSIQNETFRGVAAGGKLYFPSDSDYSQWLNNTAYYLGFYEWTDRYGDLNGGVASFESQYFIEESDGSKVFAFEFNTMQIPTFTVTWETTGGESIIPEACALNYYYVRNNVQVSYKGDFQGAMLLNEIIENSRVTRTYTMPFARHTGDVGLLCLYATYGSKETWLDECYVRWVQYGGDWMGNDLWYYETYGAANPDIVINPPSSYVPELRFDYDSCYLGTSQQSGFDFPFTKNYSSNEVRFYTYSGGTYFTQLNCQARKVLSISVNGNKVTDADDGTAKYVLRTMLLGETQNVTVTVSSHIGTPISGQYLEAYAADLQELTGSYPVSVRKVSYTDYDAYTEVIYEVTCNSDGLAAINFVYHDGRYNTGVGDLDRQLLSCSFPLNVLEVITEEFTLRTDLPTTVEEQTDTTFTVTYLTGKTVNFNTPDDIIITEGQTVDNGNGTQTTTYQIYINEEYTATTATIIITDGENTISKTITVEEKEDPMAAPTISINRYADLAFPQSGATKYITITYTNTSTSYISTPYSSEPDVTISQESVTVTDNGVEIYYGIHVPATQYERNIPLIFSCSSPEGSSATETFTGLQDGDARPEGLTLSSTSGSFAAEGESKNITVTYPSGKTLNVSVASSTGVRPIAWCTATSDGTTGGSTVYTITMTANEFTESRTALVNFSYQADGGEYITAQYVAVQAAAGGAGEESSLSLYRTVMNFSADGVFDFGAAVCKADYRWTEEVDIDEPEVDVSWIVVSEGEHQTGAGYIIVPWGIAVARNTSTSSRTGTVTFSSVGNDDIMHTAVLTVTQEGSGGGEGQEPEGVNLIWKDLPVELPDDDMVYELLDENYDVFFRGRSAKRPSDEANRFYLNRIMQDYIYMDEIPELVATTGTVRHHENAMKTVRIDYDGIIGATPAYNFKYDWSYTYDSPFILSESIIPYFVQGQRLLITCCNINDNNPQTDTYSFISGGQVQSGSISADAHDYKTMSVAVPSNTDVILLGGQRYEVLRSCQYRYVLYYLSPKGGWCWFPVMGRVNKRDNVTQYSYTKNYDNQTAEFGKSRYLAEIGTKYELNTGWLREHESLRMWEVLETNMAYLHDLYEDKVIPVIMTDETVEHKNKARDRKLISYSFNVEASQPKVRF